MGALLPGQAAGADPNDARDAALSQEIRPGAGRQPLRHARARTRSALDDVRADQSRDAEPDQGDGERIRAPRHHRQRYCTRLDGHAALDRARRDYRARARRVGRGRREISPARGAARQGHHPRGHRRSRGVPRISARRADQWHRDQRRRRANPRHLKPGRKGKVKRGKESNRMPFSGRSASGMRPLAKLIWYFYFSLFPFTFSLGVVPAYAQNYPVRPLRLLVPLAPGGGNDTTARLVGARLTESLGQPVIVENRPGAAGVVASEIVAKAPADGYTLYLVSTSFTSAPALVRKLPFDPVNDFAPVTRLAVVPGALIVHASLPVQSVKEFIALARAKPRQITFGSAGIGSGSHLGGELFKIHARVD